ncbi:MAG: cell division transport system permease protein, partial [Frankiales bacterium]|nr:cell division transport system permease protein [Frankiales bacterium]
SALLVRDQVKEMKGFWYDKIELSIYLCAPESGSANCAGKDVTQEQRATLSAALNANPEVQEVFYESKADAYKRFKEQFKDSPDLVNNISADALPESYRVKLKNPDHFAVITSAFQDQPGVDSVQDSKKLLEPVFKLLQGIQGGSLILALIMLVAATLLISITIRVAAHSRRRETGIMRLVGAGNLYIQVPFVLEGVFAGVLSAVMASGGLAVIKWIFIDGQLAPRLKFTPFVGWGTVFSVMPLLLLLGVLLSAAASFLTLRRHLRV